MFSSTAAVQGVKMRQEKREAHLATVDNLHPQFPPKLQKLMEVAKGKAHL